MHIAYQVFGKGPIDLVFVPGWVSHIEYAWDDPSFGEALQRLAAFARVIWFDKRGTGLSDRSAGLPTIEQRMDDVRAVMDAVGSDRVGLFGMSEGGSMCALFAATYPERTSALALYGAFARRLWSPDYPWAPTPEERQKWLDSLERGWGNEGEIKTLAPSLANDEQFKRWFAAYGRMSASPGEALALGKMNTQIDIRRVLPSIHVPTLVIHRTQDLDVDVGNGRFLAQSIPRAKYVELPGNDHWLFAGDTKAVLNEIEEFFTGVRTPSAIDRVLATVLFTDIVGSTERANELGDEKWRNLLVRHNEIVRRELVGSEAMK